MMRSLLILLLLMQFLGGCGRSGSDANRSQNDADAASSNRVAVQLNWYPESEHGGLYQALADGTFEQAELLVEIRPGGRATPVGPELQLERCGFAIANADDVVLFRGQDLDIVAVLAAMQNHPRCILVQEASGVETFEDLKGMTLQRQAGRGFVEFMRSRGLLDGVQEVPYHGSVASLVADPQVAIQGYSFAEPLLAEQQGVKVRTLMVSQLGFNPYSSVLITTGKLIRERPELVRRFVQATRKGWQNYIMDPEAGNTAILAANEHGMTQEALAFGADGLRSLAIPDGLPIDQVGSMSLQRWRTLVDQLAELELVDADKVRAEDCFTTEFLQ
tara:strand:+ start:34276 stop:35271 length:996 start_codon:yes stop_codon:yes gene_type:complete